MSTDNLLRSYDPEFLLKAVGVLGPYGAADQAIAALNIEVERQKSLAERKLADEKASLATVDPTVDLMPVTRVTAIAD